MLINKKTIISLGLITCILMPKVDLFSIPGFNQGLRYDDLFLLTGLIYILLQRKIFFHAIPGRKLYFIFYGFIMLYGVLSFYKYGVLSIILGLRWIEYSIFFMLLFYSSLNSENIKKFIITYIFINSIFVILQYYGLIGGIFSHGYKENLGGRVSGLTGGSWELSAVLVLFTVPLIYDKQLNYYKTIIMIIISTSLIFLAGTRSGMVTFVIVSMFALFHVYKINLTRMILILLMIIIFAFNNRTVYYVPIGDIFLPISITQRLAGWLHKFSEMDYLDYIWGKGLGYSNIYMDGMYVKIFFDMGIIGLLLFFAYYYEFLKSFKAIALVALIFSLTMDFFTGSKIMFALYLSVYYFRLMQINQLEHPDKRWHQDNISTQRNTTH